MRGFTRDYYFHDHHIIVIVIYKYKKKKIIVQIKSSLNIKVISESLMKNIAPKITYKNNRKTHCTHKQLLHPDNGYWIPKLANT